MKQVIKTRVVSLKLFIILMFEPEYYPLIMPVIGIIHDLAIKDIGGASVWASSIVPSGYYEAFKFHRRLHDRER